MSYTLRSSQVPRLRVVDILAAAQRRKRLILIIPAVFFVLALAYILVAHPYYVATSKLEIDGSDKALSLNSAANANAMGDALAANSILQTQAQILQSEAIALRVIKELNLENAPGYETSDTPPQGQGAALETSPKRIDHVMKVFSKNLSVQVIPATRLIEVSYSDRSATRAADVVNHVVQSLVDYNFQTRYKASAEASGWLGDQLTALRKRSEDLQSQVLTMQQKAGVVSSNAVDAEGHPQNYSPALDRVRGASEMLLQAQSNVILKKAIADVARNGNAEALSTLSGTALATSSPGVTSSFTALQSLRNQEASLKQEIDQARVKYGPRFPRLVELQSSLDGVERSIKEEKQRISDRAESDYKIAEMSQNMDQRVYDESRRDAISLNGKAAEYGLLREEADQSRKLYNDLLGHLQEAGVLRELHASSLTVVDLARPSSKPARPNKVLILGGALLVGLFLGLVGAFAAETISDKVNSAQMVESETGGQTIGLLPVFDGSAPSERFNEAIRSLRARLLGSPESSNARVFLVTSAVENEGKSVIALDLARALSRHGRRVLLVEANLRDPILSSRIHAKSTTGLNDLLANVSAKPAPLAIDGVPGLHVLTASISSSSPADILDSPAMQERVVQWREQYDYILFDSPSLLSFSDALPLAGLADYTLFVIREAVVSRAQLRAAIDTLLSVTSPNKVGTILNAAERVA